MLLLACSGSCKGIARWLLECSGCFLFFCCFFFFEFDIYWRVNFITKCNLRKKKYIIFCIKIFNYVFQMVAKVFKM